MTAERDILNIDEAAERWVSELKSMVDAWVRSRYF